MEQVRTELKLSGTISLNQPEVRKLAKKSSGAISMNDLRGKRRSEFVTDYLLLSDYGGNPGGCSYVRIEHKVSFTVPKDIISGQLILRTTTYSALSIGNFQRAEYGGQVIVPVSNIKAGTVYSGIAFYYGKKSSARFHSTSGDVSVKFTGEWCD